MLKIILLWALLLICLRYAVPLLRMIMVVRRLA